ncbi:MAG: hypothetical protein LAO20_14345 [Acidobacteriia bacterium]|nr:hypothetical protein [Terriglobia bacterium]
MQCQIETRKPAGEITDRQQRNRAAKCIDKRQSKRCVFCGSLKNPRVHHLNGVESDNDPRNLVYSCHAHNILVAYLMKRYNIGQRVDQEYNPAAEPAKSLAQWMMAVKSLKGESNDLHPRQAIAMIRATSPARRSSFADQIWRIRRARGTDKTAVPF